MNFSRMHPPKNRKETGLGVIEMEVVGWDCVMRTSPNDLIVAVLSGRLKVGRPVTTSVLSGEPAYLYRTSELELALTEEELRRLVRRDLMPWEVLKLHATFGMFFETHEDFYEPTTGEALQPKG